MGKFDTHGGYFAPQGYMRVNTGGSHEENPYGGVQIGVDTQGIPNMLEENEPVYDDYVYSDNIKADKALLKKYNIPEKYAGKLYSEIADKFVDEAEDRPNDPISNKGLESMLGRLAQAQEEQKQIKQQKELEQELANLSPEELAELEAMLAQQGGTEGEQNLQAPVPEMGQEQRVSPEMMSQPQMMACGGLLRRFDDGGDTEDDKPAYGRDSAPFAVRDATMTYLTPTNGMWREAPLTAEQLAARRELAEKDNLIYSMMPLIGIPNLLGEVVKETGNGEIGSAAVDLASIALPFMRPIKGASATAKAAKAADKAVKAGKGVSKAEKAKIVEAAMEEAYKAGAEAEKAGKAKKEVSAFKKALRNPLYGAGKQTAIALADKSPWIRYPAIGAAQLGQWGSETALFSGLDAGVDAAFNTWRSPWAGIPEETGSEQPEIDFGNWDYANGGLVRKFENGTPGNLDLNWTPPALNLDLNGPLFTVPQTGYIPQNPNPLGIEPLNLQPPQENLATMRYKLRKGIQPDFGGINFTPDSRLFPNGIPVGDKTGAGGGGGTGNDGETTPVQGMKPLATWPRYMGAITNGLLGLYNVFQKPDKYNIRRIQPTLPSGQMHLIDPVFNPLDENMAVNDVLANSAGTVRALANSGLGPSTSVALLAADYNTGRNIGTARTQIWDANNQRRNDVIARRNANAQALGQFNYGIDRDRAQILNDAQIRNIQNELLQQRLNYDAEGQKYAAISNSLDQVGQALSGIGQENFAMNQVNSTADYAILPNGQVVYRPRNNGNNGGLLKIFKEK